MGLFGPPPPPPLPPPSLLDSAALIADQCHLTADALVLGLVICGLFANHFWRVTCFGLVWKAAVPAVASLTADSCPLPWWVWPPYAACCMYMPLLAFLNRVHKRQPVEGAVFVTGADSGMGHWTAAQLCGAGFTVFAGFYSVKDGELDLRERVKSTYGAEALSRLHAVPCDVTSDKSVDAAAASVRKLCGASTGLVGIINCAGLGFNGPAEYFPMKMLEQQMQVNFFGYVRVVQALMPLLKDAVSKPGARRGRVVCIGTGGGVMSPSPPLLFAYMASKWSVEAFVQTLRMEMQMRKLPVDVCALNPGFVKPTALISGGLPLTEKMWAASPPQAKAEYGGLLETFIEYSLAQPGTHVSEVAKRMLEIMTVGRPWSSYKVGPDSKAAPFVGILPAGVRETIVKFSMYKSIGGNM